MIGLGYHQSAPLCRHLTDLVKDMEMNRPGKNGYRTPASKKQKKEEAKVSRRILFLHIVLNLIGSEGGGGRRRRRECQP